MLLIPPTKVLLLTAQTNKKDKSNTKEPAFPKNQVQGKSGQEHGPKAEKGESKSDRTRQKNKRGDIEKWYQTDSPEIPDRGETSEIPRSPFGGTNRKVPLSVDLLDARCDLQHDVDH